MNDIQRSAVSIAAAVCICQTSGNSRYNKYRKFNRKPTLYFSMELHKIKKRNTVNVFQNKIISSAITIQLIRLDNIFMDQVSDQFRLSNKSFYENFVICVFFQECFNGNDFFKSFCTKQPCLVHCTHSSFRNQLGDFIFSFCTDFFHRRRFLFLAILIDNT